MQANIESDSKRRDRVQAFCFLIFIILSSLSNIVLGIWLMLTVKLSIAIIIFIVSIFVLLYFRYVIFYSLYRSIGAFGETTFSRIDIQVIEIKIIIASNYFINIIQSAILLTLWPIVSMIYKYFLVLFIFIEFLLFCIGIADVVLLYAIDVGSIMDSGLWIAMVYAISTILSIFNCWIAFILTQALTNVLFFAVSKIRIRFWKSSRSDPSGTLI